MRNNKLGTFILTVEVQEILEVRSERALMTGAVLFPIDIYIYTCMASRR